MSELEKYQPEDIETTWRRAKGYALSGYFQDAKSAEQAFVKISAGAEMGLTPFQSMTGIHVIKGKPVVGAGLLAAMVDQHPDYEYTVAWDPDQATATACTVTIFKNGVAKGDSRFSMDDAKTAGLVLPGSNWEKFPSNMLFARAMSNAVRWYAAGVTGTSVYVEGEIPTFEAPRQEHAEAKPRTRVTAEVTPTPEPDEVVEDAEVLDEDPASIPFIPTGGLKDALKALNPRQLTELYAECGIAKGTKLAEVEVELWKKWAELGLPDDQEGDPVPVTILGAIYTQRAAAVASDGAAEFDRFARTGEDLDAGDQATLDAEALA